MRQIKIEDAISKYQQALAIEPTNDEAYACIGQVKALQGRTDEAIDYYQQALKINPQQVRAYHIYLILPILYDDASQIQQWRQRYTQGLQIFTKLVSDRLAVNPRSALECFGYRTNFYLAYQAQNDRTLQAQYGYLVHQVMATNYPQWAELLPMPALGTNGKIRVGYISEYFRSHSVGNMSIGWLRYCDRSMFEIHTYYTGTKVDAVTKEFEQYSDRFYQIPHNDLEAICSQIQTDRLHILVFPDIGMQPQTTQVAALRLAPVQCVWAGHPVTTGLPTIDYFLSSDGMEPSEAESHYSEQLVRLPKLGFSYTRLPMPSKLQSRTDLQLAEDCVLYLSCQMLFKYLPQYDYIFAEIAARVPQAKIAFFGRSEDSYLTDKLNRRLRKAFEQVGLDMEKYCLMLPRLVWEEYMNWLLVADVSLDTIGFSGGNTTLQAIACNLPVVTLPGEFMRGRVSYGMLQTLGVLDTVAYSTEEYIEIAVKLGKDPNWRKQIVEKISSHHGNLFDDRVAIKALEQFYKETVANYALLKKNF
jgi:predicted O-linked N-acetylglucosamine transferase (SPINDLY family)